MIAASSTGALFRSSSIACPRSRQLYRLILGAFSLFLVVSPVCGQSASDTQIQQAIEAFPEPSKTPLHRFYRDREYRFAWNASDALRDKQLALGLIGSAVQHGLSPRRYHWDEVSRPELPASPRELALRDVLMTDGVLRILSDMKTGAIDFPDRGTNIRLPIKYFDAVEALRDALSVHDLPALIRFVTPKHAEYSGLKGALEKYRQIEASGGWPAAPTWASLKPLSDAQRLTAISQRLAIEDAVVASPADEPFDARPALLRYQQRNGLAVDGRVGVRTLAALDVPVGVRIRQIAANLERWRWLPDEMETRHIAVNTAAAELKLVVGGNAELVSRVIVGDRGHPSPIMRAEVTAVTVNPAWNVPPSIARREILPKLRRNPDYLASQEMILVNGPESDPHGRRVNWSAVSANNFPYRIQQRPGPRNALGLVKLEMPNSFNVYLHDTPARGLFDAPDRLLSHGCVRVERIQELASFVISGTESGERERLQLAISEGRTRQIAIRAPVPVYLLYWTASVAGDGRVGFFPDPYGIDAWMSNHLSDGRETALKTTSRPPDGCPDRS